MSMCREVAIFKLNQILDFIHAGKSEEEIRNKCDEITRLFDCEEFEITEEEVRKDRLIEYIKFFNISYVCEYDIFDDKDMFYRILKEGLPTDIWEAIEDFLDKGNILCDYQI